DIFEIRLDRVDTTAGATDPLHDFTSVEGGEVAVERLPRNTCRRFSPLAWAVRGPQICPEYGDSLGRQRRRDRRSDAARIVDAGDDCSLVVEAGVYHGCTYLVSDVIVVDRVAIDLSDEGGSGETVLGDRIWPERKDYDSAADRAVQALGERGVQGRMVGSYAT